MEFGEMNYGISIQYSVVYTYRNRNIYMYFKFKNHKGDILNGKFIIKGNLQNLPKRLQRC